MDVVVTPGVASPANTDPTAVKTVVVVKDPSQLSNEELSAAFKQATEAPAPGTTSAPAVVTPDPAVKPAVPAPDVKPGEVKPAVTPAPSPEGAKPEDKIAALSAEVETLKRRLSDKDTFIGRQGSEIGELRKRLREEAEAGRKEFKERYFEDPEAALAARDKAVRAEGDLKSLDIQERISINKEAVVKAVPEIESMIPDIAKLAIEDGENPEVVELFRQHPYALDPAYLVGYARRVAVRKEKDALTAKLTGLEAEINKLKGGTASVVQRIEAAAAAPVVPAGAGGSATPVGEIAPLTEANIASLSDEQLKAALAQRVNKGA